MKVGIAILRTFFLRDQFSGNETSISGLAIISGVEEPFVVWFSLSSSRELSLLCVLPSFSVSGTAVAACDDISDAMTDIERTHLKLK